MTDHFGPHPPYHSTSLNCVHSDTSIPQLELRRSASLATHVDDGTNVMAQCINAAYSDKVVPLLNPMVFVWILPQAIEGVGFGFGHEEKVVR